MPLRIVSYSMRRGAYLPDALTRCINARTSDFCRRVWGGENGEVALQFDGDRKWTTHAKAVDLELAEADVVIVHDGRVASQHQDLLSGKAVVTLAENFLKVDQTYLQKGLPGVMLGQHRVVPQGSRDWRIVPLPIPHWEERYQLGQKGQIIRVFCVSRRRRTPDPPNHFDRSLSRSSDGTMQVLESLAAGPYGPLEIMAVGRAGWAESLENERRSHIVMDEWVAGGYSRQSLEALATGAVVVNGRGLRPAIQEAFGFCAGGEQSLPFLVARQGSLGRLISSLMRRGPEQLVADGADNRQWMERHWDFGKQWTSFWLPVISDALAARRSKPSARGVAPKIQRTTGSRRRLSVVVVSHNEGVYLRRTVHSLMSTLPRESEVIVVDDGSSDRSADGLAESYHGVTVLRTAGRLGVSRARNFGAEYAQGEVVVFSDAHIEVPVKWTEPLLEALETSDVGAVGPAINNLKRRTGPGKCGGTWHWDDRMAPVWKWLDRLKPNPYSVPLLCGCFFAMRRDVLRITAGFDPGLRLYGLEDAELSLRLWTLGYQCRVVPGVIVSHRFGSVDTKSPARFKFRSEIFAYNMLRLAIVHFGLQRLRRLIEGQARYSGFPAVFARLASSDAWERRNQVQAARVYDDDWFFSRFGIG